MEVKGVGRMRKLRWSRGCFLLVAVAVFIAWNTFSVSEATDSLNVCAQLVEKDGGTKALTACQQAVSENPGGADGYFWRGSAYTQLNRFDEAIADFNRYIASSPDEAVAYKNRAAAYRGKGDFQSALRDANRAIQLDPNLYEAYVLRSLLNFVLGRNLQAMQDANQAISLEPNREPAYTVRGFIYNWAAFDHQSAAADYVKAASINPNSWQLRAFRAEHAFYFASNPQLAVQEIQAAYAAKPEGDWTFLVMAEILRDSQQLDQAMQICNAAITLSTSPWMAYIHRAGIWLRKGDLNAAYQDANRSLAIAPDSASGLFMRSLINLQRQNLLGAVNDCKLALEVSEGQYWYCWGNIGAAYDYYGDRASAAKAYEAYLSLSPVGDPQRAQVQQRFNQIR